MKTTEESRKMARRLQRALDTSPLSLAVDWDDTMTGDKRRTLDTSLALLIELMLSDVNVLVITARTWSRSSGGAAASDILARLRAMIRARGLLTCERDILTRLWFGLENGCFLRHALTGRRIVFSPALQPVTADTEFLDVAANIVTNAVGESGWSVGLKTFTVTLRGLGPRAPEVASHLRTLVALMARPFDIRCSEGSIEIIPDKTVTKRRALLRWLRELRRRNPRRSYTLKSCLTMGDRTEEGGVDEELVDHALGFAVGKQLATRNRAVDLPSLLGSTHWGAARWAILNAPWPKAPSLGRQAALMSEEPSALPESDVTICVVLGGTMSRSALVSLEVRLVSEVSWSDAFDVYPGCDHAEQRLVDGLADQILLAARQSSGRAFSRIVLSVKGPLKLVDDEPILGPWASSGLWGASGYPIRVRLRAALERRAGLAGFGELSKLAILVQRDAESVVLGEVSPSGTVPGGPAIAVIIGSGLGIAVYQNGVVPDAAEDDLHRLFSSPGRHCVKVEGSYQWRPLMPGKTVCFLGDGERCGSDLVTSPAVAGRIAQDSRSARLVRVDSGLTRDDFARLRSGEREARTVANVLTALAESAGGDLWAADWIQGIGIEIGQVLGCFLNAFNAAPWSRNTPIILTNSLADCLSRVHDGTGTDIFLSGVDHGLRQKLADLGLPAGFAGPVMGSRFTDWSRECVPFLSR